MRVPREFSSETWKPQGKRPDASMSLLLRLMEDPLDADYARAAAGSPAETPASRRPARAILFAALLLVSMGTTMAVGKARDEPISDDHRRRLVAEINELTAVTDRLQQRLVRLRQRTARVRAATLAKSEKGQDVRERLRRLELAAGVTPAEGPGLVVTVNDAPPSEGGLQGQAMPVGADRVLDRDLQALVDALWTAGAEAIAVDGQRVTSLTAIRSAGKAILVNYRPTNPPYTVEATGNPDALRTGFARSETGRRFHTLRANVGIRFGMEKSQHLRLPGASGVSLRYVREAGSG